MTTVSAAARAASPIRLESRIPRQLSNLHLKSSLAIPERGVDIGNSVVSISPTRPAVILALADAPLIPVPVPLTALSRIMKLPTTAVPRSIAMEPDVLSR